MLNLDEEIVPAQRSTILRRNLSQELRIGIKNNNLRDIYLINGSNFITKGILKSDLRIKPHSYYMVINKGNKSLHVHYNQEITKHQVIYDPYKYESSKKINFEKKFFEIRYEIPQGYIDTLPKWYSFKFTYPNYNLIFVRPEFGLSIQIHYYRNEYWEILEGHPIIINGDKVYYFVENGAKFQNSINTFHSIINPNREKNKFIVLKERWSGKFKEEDIIRVFNPNHYQ